MNGAGSLRQSDSLDGRRAVWPPALAFLSWSLASGGQV